MTDGLIHVSEIAVRLIGDTQKQVSKFLSVIASEAKQSRGRSTTVWVAGARMLWPLDCFVARAPRNDGWVAADPIVSVVIGAA